MFRFWASVSFIVCPPTSNEFASTLTLLAEMWVAWILPNEPVVAVKVAPLNVKSASSLNTPFVPAKTTLPLVNPSAVSVWALKSWDPISVSPPTPSTIANFCAVDVVSVPLLTSKVLLLPTVISDVAIVAPSIVPLSISTFVIFWLLKFISPAASKAPIFVAVNVSPLNVKSLSSDNTPFVPANTTLPLESPSAVSVAALKSCEPISKSPPAVNDVIPSIVPPSISTASEACVAILPNPNDVLAVPAVSNTKFEPSPTIKPPSVTANPATSASWASYAWTSVPIVNPNDVLAVAPVSNTKLLPSPTIKPPSVTANPATSANWASYACTFVPIAKPNDVLNVSPVSNTKFEPLPTITPPSVFAKPATSCNLAAKLIVTVWLEATVETPVPPAIVKLWESKSIVPVPLSPAIPKSSSISVPSSVATLPASEELTEVNEPLIEVLFTENVTFPVSPLTLIPSPATAVAT